MLKRLLCLTAVALTLAAGCGEPGIGGLARFGVADSDRVEVRRVFWDPDELESRSAETSATPFGAGSILTGSTTDPAEVERLVTAVSEARYIDTGNVVLDLANPDFEVLFFEEDRLLTRLGYYAESIGPWGEHEVPGRWMEPGQHWRLLTLTIELPAHLME